MKVLVLSNFIKKNHELVTLLEEKYHVPVFFMKDLSYENNHKKSYDEVYDSLLELIKKNSDWILFGIPEHHLDFMSSNASSIIYLERDFKVSQRRKILLPFLQRFPSSKVEKTYDVAFLREYFKKYSRKIYIIKNKNDYKKLLKALEKGMDL